MSKKIIAAIALLSSSLLLAVILVAKIISTLNYENQLAALIKAKQLDNKSEMDAMWKTISQTAQVSEQHKSALIEIFNGYAGARTGQSGGGSLATWIKEAVPNVDLATFNNLQNIIVAKRDGFAMRQKELLDYSRQHNQLLGTVVSGTICSVFGRKPVDVVIVTSTRTEESFKTGKDDEVKLFEK